MRGGKCEKGEPARPDAVLQMREAIRDKNSGRQEIRRSSFNDVAWLEHGAFSRLLTFTMQERYFIVCKGVPGDAGAFF